MKRGRIQGRVWPPTTHRCHERHNSDRCKLERGHTEFLHSKNPGVDQLNGWHQSRGGCWKDGTFMMWPEFETLRRRVFKEAS